MPSAVDGVLVVDKPPGLTSHDVVAVARRALGERRIGHTGTLDPLATGVLPLACGRATRLVRLLAGSRKEYDATIRFGLATDTYDVTGRDVSRSGRVPDRDAVERALASLRGHYLQTPPAYSAKKVGGRKAYELARRDQAVALRAVPVHVTRADLLACDGATARVAIVCSAGFYVRSFADALGTLVGTGACLEALRRTRSGEFGLDTAVSLEHLREHPQEAVERLVGIDALLPALPRVVVTSEGRRRISHGQEIDARHRAEAAAPWSPASGEPAESDWTRLVDEDGRILALGRPGIAPGALHPSVVLI